MSETHITLYGDDSEAFERVAEEFGPDGVEPSNAEVVRRLIEAYETEWGGGLTR